MQSISKLVVFNTVKNNLNTSIINPPKFSLERMKIACWIDDRSQVLMQRAILIGNFSNSEHEIVKERLSHAN